MCTGVSHVCLLSHVRLVHMEARLGTEPARVTGDFLSTCRGCKMNLGPLEEEQALS